MKSNLFAGIPDELPEEFLEGVLTRGGTRIGRIVSRGHVTPPGEWYDQEEHEWLVVLRGSARLKIEDRDDLVELGPGDHVSLPPHLRHRVEWTDPEEDTVWLVVFTKADAE